MSNGKPNVLVIQPDQHRGTVMGCAGDSQVKTPNLDRLGLGGDSVLALRVIQSLCVPHFGGRCRPDCIAIPTAWM